MRLQISFLVELESASIDRTCIRFFVCVSSLMREKLVHTPKNFHAHLLFLSVIVRHLRKYVRGHTFEIAMLDHFLQNLKSVGNILFVSLSYLSDLFPSSSFHFLNALAVALEQSEGLQSLVLPYVEHHKIITVWHVHLLAILARREEHVKVRILLKVVFWLHFFDIWYVIIPIGPIFLVYFHSLSVRYVNYLKHLLVFFTVLNRNQPILANLVLFHEVIWQNMSRVIEVEIVAA